MPAQVEEETTGPKKRSGKVPLFIDFVDAAEVDEDELFAPAEATSLMFTAANETENRKSKHVLPDDVHFSSKQLLRMFLKPSYIVSSHEGHWRGYHLSLVTLLLKAQHACFGIIDQVQDEEATAGVYPRLRARDM